MKLPPINWPIYCIAFFYWMIETSAFGWNLAPGSPAEVLADGIAFVLFAMALAFPPKARPAMRIRRVVGANGEQKGLFIVVDAGVQIHEAEDLRA